MAKSKSKTSCGDNMVSTRTAPFKKLSCLAGPPTGLVSRHVLLAINFQWASRLMSSTTLHSVACRSPKLEPRPIKQRAINKTPTIPDRHAKPSMAADANQRDNPGWSHRIRTKKYRGGLPGHDLRRRLSIPTVAAPGECECFRKASSIQHLTNGIKRLRCLRISANT